MSSYEFKSNALCVSQYVSGLTYICIYIYMDSVNGDYDEVDGEKGHMFYFQVVSGLFICRLSRGYFLVVLLAGFINLA